MRDHLEAIWRAGLEACLPERVLPPHLPEPPPGRTILLAFGKAAFPMAATVEARWPAPLSGLAVAPRAIRDRFGGSPRFTPTIRCPIRAASSPPGAF